ncbi:MAG: ACP S-malonyltransferase [Leptospirales bacterium]
MSNNKTAAVFPGQGAQRPGMAQDFYENHEIAKNIFDSASEATGENLSELCFTENEKVNLTEFTQPAILTTEIAIYRVLEKEYGFSPSFFAGHSLGEYAALVAASVIPFEDAVKIVRRRGALMQSAIPEGVGTMAALLIENIESTDFEQITKDAGAEVANYNSTGQIVISGKKENVDAATEKLDSAIEGIRIVPLSVSAPFHSSLMKEIEPEFKAFLESFAPKFNLDNASKVLSNFTGNFHDSAGLIDNLVSQISGSVRWMENMRVLKDTGTDIYEIGPNKILTKFFATIDVKVPAIINERSAKKAFEP